MTGMEIYIHVLGGKTERKTPLLSLSVLGRIALKWI
jgi:hypothetical protein